MLQEYEDADEDEYVSEFEDTDVDDADDEGPALPLHLEQALGEVVLQLLLRGWRRFGAIASSVGFNFCRIMLACGSCLQVLLRHVGRLNLASTACF